MTGSIEEVGEAKIESRKQVAVRKAISGVLSILAFASLRGIVMGDGYGWRRVGRRGRSLFRGTYVTRIKAVRVSGEVVGFWVAMVNSISAVWKQLSFRLVVTGLGVFVMYIAFPTREKSKDL